MFEFDLVQCLALLMILMVIGEVISRRMKAAIPAILVSALVFLALVWSGIVPKNMVQTSGIMTFTGIAMSCVIVSMGASTNPKELFANWRVVALAAISYFVQIAVMLLVIGALYGKNMAIGSLPGGAAVALMVQGKARSLGYDQVVLLSALILSVKGLFSCPLASFFLKKEVKRIIRLGIPSDCLNEEKENAAIRKKTGKHESENMSLMRFIVTAWIANRLELLTGVSQYVYCLLLGVLFAQLGLIHKDEMDRTKSHGMLMLMMMSACLNGFANATPEIILKMLVPLLCVIVVEISAIFVNSRIFGKAFGFSREMSFLICLNIMVGFPLNMMLSDDIIRFLVEDPKEQELLHGQVATKMVIAGFTSVTFLATVTMGILVGFIN